jgi:hypothetical protein
VMGKGLPRVDSISPAPVPARVHTLFEGYGIPVDKGKGH